MTTSTAPSPSTTPVMGPSRHQSDIAEVPPKAVQDWLRAGTAVLIDVREPDEHARERIEGAQLLPLSRFDAQAASTLAKPGQRIVLHCRGGKRSADACRMLMHVPGISAMNVVSMAGGIEAWKSALLPVALDTRAPRISVMRQVQLIIGVCVLVGSALAYFVHPAFMGIPAFFGAGLTFAGASGTCALATIVGRLPWNRTIAATCGTGASCAIGS